MRNIGIILVLLSLFLARRNTIIDWFKNGRFDGTMYDYLHSNFKDWDSTLLLVERAGLERFVSRKQVGYEK